MSTTSGSLLGGLDREIGELRFSGGFDSEIAQRLRSSNRSSPRGAQLFTRERL